MPRSVGPRALTPRACCAFSTEGAIELCKSPKTYTGLEPGEHTFTVIAGSVAGNYVSDTHTWRIIRPGEDTMVTSFTPVRLADTRPGWVAADGLFVGTGAVGVDSSCRCRLPIVAKFLPMRRRPS